MPEPAEGAPSLAHWIREHPEILNVLDWIRQHPEALEVLAFYRDSPIDFAAEVALARLHSYAWAERDESGELVVTLRNESTQNAALKEPRRIAREWLALGELTLCSTCLKTIIRFPGDRELTWPPGPNEGWHKCPMSPRGDAGARFGPSVDSTPIRIQQRKTGGF